MSRFLICTDVFFLKIKVSRNLACNVSAWLHIQDGGPHAIFDQNIKRTKQDMTKVQQAIPFSKIFSVKQTEDEHNFCCTYPLASTMFYKTSKMVNWNSSFILSCLSLLFKFKLYAIPSINVPSVVYQTTIYDPWQSSIVP